MIDVLNQMYSNTSVWFNFVSVAIKDLHYAVKVNTAKDLHTNM